MATRRTSAAKEGIPSRGPPPAQVGAVFELLDRTARRLRQIHELTVRSTGLTPAQHTVLRVLWRIGAASPAQLASECGCTRATMTGIVDTLEKHGLVVREPNPMDRRGIVVTPTSAGSALRSKARGLEELFGCCCSGLNAEELSALYVLLSKLSHSLERPGQCSE